MSDRDFVAIGKLGEGTYGEVHKVKRISDNQQYAMKKVKIMDLKEKDKRNTLNQIRILASIDHPNIIQYKEAFFDEQSNRLCIIMELAPGGDLAEKIRNKFKRAQGFYQYEIWKYGLAMLQGLKHLHSLNIIHRDLKPANIFFGDLNVSRHVQSQLVKTQTGTPNYASPQIWNNSPYSFECDIWSFGCIIYEMCCFKPPFRSKNMDELYQKIQSGQYDKIPKRYSIMLEEAISKCLEKQQKRIKLDELMAIFSKYSTGSCRVIKKSNSAMNLLSTIQFPKDKKEFSNILPSPKYSLKTIPVNPQETKKRIISTPESVLNKFMKDPNPSLLQRRRLSNKAYYDEETPKVKICRSQKIIPNSYITEKSVAEKKIQKYEQKNVSFKHILQSLEQAKIQGRRPLQKMNMRRRHMRMGLGLI